MHAQDTLDRHHNGTSKVITNMLPQNVISAAYPLVSAGEANR